MRSFFGFSNNLLSHLAICNGTWEEFLARPRRNEPRRPPDLWFGTPFWSVSTFTFPPDLMFITFDTVKRPIYSRTTPLGPACWCVQNKNQLSEINKDACGKWNPQIILIDPDSVGSPETVVSSSARSWSPFSECCGESWKNSSSDSLFSRGSRWSSKCPPCPSSWSWSSDRDLEFLRRLCFFCISS